MKVLVTGAQGFVGKILVAALREKGIEVHGVDIVPGTGAHYYTADIRDRKIVDVVPQELDAIIHLAGLIRPSDCADKKVYTCFDINVMATLNLIDAAQTKNAKQFIFASTEWVYGEWQDAKSVRNEDSPLIAHSLATEYAFSKLVSEENLRQKFQHGFCPITLLRFGIIYGPRDKNWCAVESIFNAVKTKEEIQVGSLRTGRCFIHVEDIVSGIMASLGLGGFNIINLVGDQFIALSDIIEESKKILGKNPKVVETSGDNYNIRNVSNKKAANLIGWRPRYGLQEGLKSLMIKEKETVLR